MTTPPAKAGGFLQSHRPQQRLLKLRMTRSSTLTLEGPIQAHCLVSTAFQVLRADLLRTAGNLKLVKSEGRRGGTEAIILLIPPVSTGEFIARLPKKQVQSTKAMKGDRAHSSAASRRQSPALNPMGFCTHLTVFYVLL